MSVLLFDYRGYGGNPGSPSEAGLAADARAARGYLDSRPEVRSESVVFYGESLGAGVAIGLAAEWPPAALVLRSPFTSLADVGRRHYPYLPVRQLLKERYDSIGRIADLLGAPSWSWPAAQTRSSPPGRAAASTTPHPRPSRTSRSLAPVTTTSPCSPATRSSAKSWPSFPDATPPVEAAPRQIGGPSLALASFSRSGLILLRGDQPQIRALVEHERRECVPQVVQPVKLHRQPGSLHNMVRSPYLQVDSTLTFEEVDAWTRLRWDWRMGLDGPMRVLSQLLVGIGPGRERRNWLGLKEYMESGGR